MYTSIGNTLYIYIRIQCSYYLFIIIISAFEDIDIAAQATTFFIDGFETSSVALSFALYALATNPDIQTKLRAEVTAVLKEDGGELTYDGIHKMTYLDKVLSGKKKRTN